MLNHDQLRQFKLLYGRRTNKELSAHFAIPVSEIEDIAHRFMLSKDKRTFKGKRMPRWSPEEISKLRYMYPVTPNLAIARSVGRSVKSIVSKAHELKLTKDSTRLTEMGRENVALRWERTS